MLCRAFSIGGAVLGWGTLVVFSFFELMSHDRTMPVMVLAGVTALTSTNSLMHMHRQRPLGVAYELGYEQGRRDAIRDANRREPSPIRHVPEGLDAFSRRSPRRRSVRSEGIRLDA